MYRRQKLFDYQFLKMIISINVLKGGGGGGTLIYKIRTFSSFLYENFRSDSYTCHIMDVQKKKKLSDFIIETNFLNSYRSHVAKKWSFTSLKIKKRSSIWNRGRNFEFYENYQKINATKANCLFLQFSAREQRDRNFYRIGYSLFSCFSQSHSQRSFEKLGRRALAGNPSRVLHVSKKGLLTMKEVSRPFKDNPNVVGMMWMNQTGGEILFRW